MGVHAQDNPSNLPLDPVSLHTPASDEKEIPAAQRAVRAEDTFTALWHRAPLLLGNLYVLYKHMATNLLCVLRRMNHGREEGSRMRGPNLRLGVPKRRWLTDHRRSVLNMMRIPDKGKREAPVWRHGRTKLKFRRKFTKKTSSSIVSTSCTLTFYLSVCCLPGSHTFANACTRSSLSTKSWGDASRPPLGTTMLVSSRQPWCTQGPNRKTFFGARANNQTRNGG